ncbi:MULTISPECIES: hypothetical protein [Cryobacterium]|uniref:Phospholipase n=1 Tax=Cryobacterium shii TaxID=1259235 RepID=A0AAQ2HGY5_9MICO|nr:MULTISPECIES: hypothetical protein [Cryobacterium]TFC52559.1 hypothetical protein E3O49_01080 [Cryobacterium shii]TFD27931.1 hypothetical protein E3T32_01300 [Cryobacterium sp. TMT2-23]
MIVAGSVLGIAGLVAGVGTTAVAQSSAASAESIAETRVLSESTGVRHGQLSVYSAIAKSTADHRAESTISAATGVIATMANKVDATPLASSVASLGNYEELETDAVISLTLQTKSETAAAQSAVAEVDRAAASAEAEAAAAAAAAAEQARAVAAQAAAAEAAKASQVAPAPAPSPSGGNSPDAARATARAMAASNYGWGDSEFSCLNQLWERESGWSYTAYNPSGATGIPQALPGSKMATTGSDWATNATTQIAWGLGYISGSYGSPCSAWAHSEANNWY